MSSLRSIQSLEGVARNLCTRLTKAGLHAEIEVHRFSDGIRYVNGEPVRRSEVVLRYSGTAPNGTYVNKEKRLIPDWYDYGNWMQERSQILAEIGLVKSPTGNHTNLWEAKRREESCETKMDS